MLASLSQLLPYEPWDQTTAVCFKDLVAFWFGVVGIFQVQAQLGDIAGSHPDHYTKVNMALK